MGKKNCISCCTGIVTTTFPNGEVETPILCPPDAKIQLIEKHLVAGKDWRWEEGTTEDKKVGWHHWLNGHESEQVPGDGEGQGSLACGSPWGRKELSTTEKLNNYYWVGRVRHNWAHTHKWVWHRETLEGMWDSGLENTTRTKETCVLEPVLLLTDHVTRSEWKDIISYLYLLKQKWLKINNKK